LGEGVGAGIVHLLHALGTVVAHAGEDDADGVGAGVACGGAEEYVDGGAVPADERAIAHLDKVAVVGAFDERVFASGSDQRVAGQDGGAVGPFAHLEAAEGIEVGGKGAGEPLGHVLHDDDAGRLCGQASEEGRDCLGAAGRGADEDDLLSRGDACAGLGLGQDCIGGEFGPGADAPGEPVGADAGGGLDGIADEDA